MRFATLISWLVTAGLGAFMLRTWLARGGLRRERAKVGGLPPQVIFGHAVAAISGLLSWVAFLTSGARPFAWAAVILLTAAVSLGLCTVTLWTPYPARKPGEWRSSARSDSPVVGVPAATDVPAAADVPSAAPGAEGQGIEGQGAEGQGEAQPAFEVTDDMISRFLADPAPGGYPVHPDLALLVPIVHGFAAITTYLLAVMSAIT